MNSLFVNEPVPVDGLPRLSDDAFVPVDQNLLRVSLLGYGLSAVLAVGGAIAWKIFDDASGWIPLVVMTVLLVLIVCATALRVLEVRHIAYQVRSHDISYRSGVLIKKVSTVPFVRVQHARVRQGPIERRFGISTLDVNSAGPDLAISGLTTQVAEQLKTLVVERAGDLVEDL